MLIEWWTRMVGQDLPIIKLTVLLGIHAIESIKLTLYNYVAVKGLF